jgi:hypothetical protein
MRILSVFSFFLLLQIALAGPAAAQGAPTRKLQQADLNYLLFVMQGQNATEALAAIAELGRRKTPESLDLLQMQLLLGYPPAMTKAMIQALGARKDPKSMDTLVFYTRHRAPELRAEALVALCELDFGKEAGPQKTINDLLLGALRDYDESVRNKAAWLVGRRRVAEAEDSLLKLFSTGSAPAMQALGFVGGIRTARALALAMENTRASKEPLITTIGTLLSRDDFGPEPVRVQLVQILGDTNLPGAQNVLMVYHGSGPEAFPRSRKLAFQILSK